MTQVSNQSVVMFWNLWGHRIPQGISEHIKSHIPQVDIFCFTEVTKMGLKYKPVPLIHTGRSDKEPPSCPDGVGQLITIVKDDYMTVYNSPNSRSWTCLVTGKTYHQIGFGSALIYRRDLNVVQKGNFLICKNLPSVNARSLQWIVYVKGNNRYLVAHLHGVWIADNTKGDHAIRDLQSKEVREKLHNLVTKYKVKKVIFGGDFNLAINTDALAAMIRVGSKQVLTRNLVVEHSIESTRTSYYRKFGQLGESQHADYVLVSEDVNVHDFQVGNSVLASDHAPIRVRFS